MKRSIIDQGEQPMRFENKKHTPETKQRISEKLKEYNRLHPELKQNRMRSLKEYWREIQITKQELAAAGIPFPKRVLSEEHKARISAAMKGRKPSLEALAALKQKRKENKEERELIKFLDSEKW